MKVRKKKVAAKTKAKVGAKSKPMKMLEGGGWVHHDTLTRWDKNPRDNKKAVPKVAASIREYGFVAPIVVDPKLGRIVAGDTRLLATRAILVDDPQFVARGAPGPGMVRVVFHEFKNEAAAIAYGIADNKLNELAMWSKPILDEHLATMKPETLMVIGFDERIPTVGNADETVPMINDDGINYQQQFGVVVVCENEAAQQKAYDELEKMGYKLRVLTV